MCKIRLYNYPCLVMNLEGSAKPVFPEHREYSGHSSHITEIQFTTDDRYVLSAGGADLTVLRWRVVAVPGAGKQSASSSSAAVTSGDGQATVAEDVAQAKIRELGTSTRRNFIDEQKYADPGTPFPGVGSTITGTTGRSTTVRSASASAVGGQRRPFSGNVGVKSRLFDRTASTQAKAELGMRHREHVEKEMSNLRRFQGHR
jgi:hypothetical protein